MLSVAFALAGSVIYGASDFFGGLAARGTSAVRVALINSIAGLAVLVVAALVLPWGVLAGVIPVTIGLVRGERLSDLGYLGLAIGLVAIVLICLVPGERAVRPSPRGLLVTFVVSGIVMSVALLSQRLARRGAPRRG